MIVDEIFESNTNRRTAMAIAKELHANLMDLIHIRRAGGNQGPSNPRNIQSLQQDSVDLHNQLEQLGFEFDFRAPDFIRPLTMDATQQIKLKEYQCMECGGPAFTDLVLAEKKDACYYKVKSRYKVWPSAYASGALVQCRKKGSKNWGSKNENADQAPPQREPVRPSKPPQPVKRKPVTPFGPGQQAVAEAGVKQLPTQGADYSKYDTDHLKMLLRPGILHRNEARFKVLIRKELQKREQQSQQGVAEGIDSNDPWGPQGRFAGDEPVNLGGDKVQALKVGDTVTYFGERATIEAMSKDSAVSRIHLPNSNKTQNVRTQDLKRTLKGMAEATPMDPEFKNKRQEYHYKRKALQDIALDPETSKNPQLKAELARRKAELEKWAQQQGIAQGALEEISQIDELKCWTGYHRVPGKKAGSPGSCAPNESIEESWNDLVIPERLVKNETSLGS